MPARKQHKRNYPARPFHSLTEAPMARAQLGVRSLLGVRRLQKCSAQHSFGAPAGTNLCDLLAAMQNAPVGQEQTALTAPQHGSHVKRRITIERFHGGLGAGRVQRLAQKLQARKRPGSSVDSACYWFLASHTLSHEPYPAARHLIGLLVVLCEIYGKPCRENKKKHVTQNTLKNELQLKIPRTQLEQKLTTDDRRMLTICTTDRGSLLLLRGPEYKNRMPVVSSHPF